MAPKKPKTFAQRARAISEHQRFQLNQARDLIDELGDGAEEASSYTDLNPEDAISILRQMIESFDSLSGYGTPIIDQPDQIKFTELVDELEGLMPETDEVQALHDTWDEARDSVDELEQMRDSPSDYSPDEREGARETAREKFDALAAALEADL